MASPTGTCKLCLTPNIPLRESHVIPAWAYKRLLDDRPGENPSAIKIEDGEARHSAKQVKEYLLCGDCEQKLGVYDNYTSTLAFKNGTLPARAAVGAISGSDGRVEVAKPGTLDSVRLAYFACSVVWRGHIATTLPRCCLGPATISEAFRAYLNGERAFPPKVQATLSLLLNDEPTKAQLGQVITMPLSMRKRPHYSHEFALCGMYFAVRTGVAPSALESSLMSAEPMITLTPRRVFKEWLGPDLLSAEFVGRKPPTGSRGSSR